MAATKGFDGVPPPDKFYVDGLHHTWLFNSDGSPKDMNEGVTAI
jgi:hypothetical protein